MNSSYLTHFITRFTLQLPSKTVPATNQILAAVLVPIICRSEPTLLLTKRACSLRHHAGQIAFPGGRKDSSDPTLIATALREAQEEVAIALDQVTVLGQLAPLDSSSGFNVTPIIGLLPANIPLQANINEVELLFEIPLYEALTLSHYHTIDVQQAGKTRHIYCSVQGQQLIWGLTAAIIYQIAQHVRI